MFRFGATVEGRAVLWYHPIGKEHNMIAAIVIAIIVLALLLWAVVAYNSFVKLSNKAEEADAGIDAELKKRYDLVPNLVETVKGYAAHESSTLEAVISARNEAATAEGREAKDSADRGLRSALSRLFALSESYPDLKANQNFLSLQDDMRDIETSILNARKYYNAVVREYNDSIMVFPSSLIASVFHFRKKEYVEIDDAHKESIRVEF